MRSRLADSAAQAWLRLSMTTTATRTRAVYTVKFEGVVYVLHVFQKKSKRGIQTPKPEVDLIKSRLKRAQEHYAEWTKQRNLP
jgi:phage-related protein